MYTGVSGANFELGSAWIFFGNLWEGAGVGGKSVTRVYFGVLDSFEIFNLGSVLPGGAGVGG